jgi:hypothetical protein
MSVELVLQLRLGLKARGDELNPGVLHLLFRE